MGDDLHSVIEDSARGSFFLISGTAVSTVVMAVASILVGRLLGPEQYGQYTLAFVIPQLLFLLTDFGMNQGIVKFTATFKAKGETGRIVTLIKYSILFKMIAGIIFFAINYVLAGQFASVLLQRPDLVFYIRLASTSIIFQVIVTTATSAFIGLDKSEYAALANNVQAFAKSALSITFVLFGLSVMGAILGHVASYIVAAVAGIAFLYFLVRGRLEASTTSTGKEDFKALITYGAPLYVSVLLAGFMPLYQNFVLAFFATDTDIGNFKAAQNFVTLIAILSGPITTALLPGFAKLDPSNVKRIKSFFSLSNKYTSLLIVPVTVLIIIYSTEMVQIIYGSAWQTAPVFLATYSMVYLLVGLGYITLSSLYNGLGETKTTLMMSAVAFLILGILSPVLGNILRVQGVIFAFIVASAVATTVGFYWAKRKYQIGLRSPAVAKIYMIAVFSAVPSLLLFRFAHLPGLVDLVIGVSLYLIIYITLAPLVRIVTTAELRTISKLTHKTRPLRILVNPLIKYELKISRMAQHRQSPADSQN